MRTDALVTLIPLNGALSLVGGAGVSIPTNPMDLLGIGVGQSPITDGVIMGNVVNLQFGTDFGIGDDRLLLNIVMGAGLVTGNGATLNLAFQGAPDTGQTGGWLPGTWQTFVETGPLTPAQCTAGTRIARFDWAAAFPENQPLPRFVRLLAQIPATTNFTAGSIAFALATSARDDLGMRQAARNYAVS